MKLNMQFFIFSLCAAGLICVSISGCYKKNSAKNSRDTETADTETADTESDVSTAVSSDHDTGTPIPPDSESGDSEVTTDSQVIETHCRAPQFENLIPAGSDAVAIANESVEFDGVTFSAVSTAEADARIGWADLSSDCSTGIWMGTTTAENAVSDRVSMASGFPIRLDFPSPEDTAFGLSFVARVPLGAKIVVTLFDVYQSPLSSNEFQPLPAADPGCVPELRYVAAEQRLTFFSDTPVAAVVIEASGNYVFQIKDVYFSTSLDSSPACPWVDSGFFEDTTIRCDISNVAYPRYRCIDKPATISSCDLITPAEFNDSLYSERELGCFRAVDDLLCGPVTYKEPDECCFYISESETEEICMD